MRGTKRKRETEKDRKCVWVCARVFEKESDREGERIFTCTNRPRFPAQPSSASSAGGRREPTSTCLGPREAASSSGSAPPEIPGTRNREYWLGLDSKGF